MLANDKGELLFLIVLESRRPRPRHLFLVTESLMRADPWVIDSCLIIVPSLGRERKQTLLRFLMSKSPIHEVF